MKERAQERIVSSSKSQVDVSLDSVVHFGTPLSIEKAGDALYAAPLSTERSGAQGQGHKEPRKVIREVRERAPENKKGKVTYPRVLEDLREEMLSHEQFV